MSPAASEPIPASFDSRTIVLTQFILLLGVVFTPPGQFISLFAFALLIAGAAFVFRTQIPAFLAKSKRALPVAMLIVLPVLLLRGLVANDSAVWLTTAGLLLKVLLALSCVIVLLVVLPFHEILFALRRLRVPTLFLDILAMAFRYIDVINAERVQLVRSLAARGHTGAWIWQSRMPGKLAGSLFLRTIERGERIHMAMLARGYEGAAGGLLQPSRLVVRDFIVLDTAGLVALLILWILP
ncbi:energy-coupling factor transporter transmembrane protein EcfT [bacterium]|nr:energy-coupling factor transporter transmembrane protein EcfT [bacterium]